jgi:hypothetical protein
MTESETENEIAADENWSAVKGVESESEAAILMGFLESHEIPARLLDKSSREFPAPDDEELTAMEVSVPASRLEEARAVLSQHERRSSTPRGCEAVITDDGETPLPKDGEE